MWARVEPSEVAGRMVGREGIEPPQSKTADLQSAELTTCSTYPLSVPGDAAASWCTRHAMIRAGADDGTRTRNRRFTKPLLYQLSYVGARRTIPQVTLWRPGMIGRSDRERQPRSGPAGPGLRSRRTRWRMGPHLARSGRRSLTTAGLGPPGSRSPPVPGWIPRRAGPASSSWRRADASLARPRRDPARAAEGSPRRRSQRPPPRPMPRDETASSGNGSSRALRWVVAS